jgi:uncharacterized membrane protein (DUF441 family)
MNNAILILLVILGLGILSKNSTVWIPALILIIITTLAIKFPKMSFTIQWLEAKGIYWGIIILTLGVLSTIASEKVGWSHMVETAKSMTGWFSVAVGIGVAYLGGKGAHLLGARPDVLTGLLVGTILGVAFFRGVPVGPLIAAGILAVLSGVVKM